MNYNKEFEGPKIKVMINRSKAVRGYDYYLTVLHKPFGDWVINGNYKQPDITSEKKALEEKDKIFEMLK